MLWLLAAGLLLLGPTPEQLQAQERLKEGQRLMTTEKFEAAAQAFREAIELDPILTMAHYGLGQAHMALKQYPSAVTAFRGAREAFQKRVAEGNTRRMEDSAAREERIRALREQIREIQEQQVTGTGPAAQRTAVQREQRVQEWELQITTLRQSQLSESKPPELPPVCRSPWAVPTSAAASLRTPNASTVRRWSSTRSWESHGTTSPWSSS